MPMIAASTGRLRVGAWCVDPTAGRISRDGQTVRVEARTMRLLTCLAARAGQTVSIDELLDGVWPDVTVSPDSVYQAVASLRRLLGDDPKAPRYIATAPRLGYRMVAEVAPWRDEPPGGPARMALRLRPAVLLAAAGLVATAGAGWWLQGRVTREAAPQVPAAVARSEASIAVMPFLDLTDAMDHEPFADGVTEELIDQLSRNPGLRVASPRSSFQFKGKRATAAEVSRALSVAYVLDGSVRKSGERLRVAARLVQGDSGFVVWSESYDRPAGDLLWVQQDIAGEVAGALAGGPRKATSAAAVAP